MRYSKVVDFKTFRLPKIGEGFRMDRLHLREYLSDYLLYQSRIYEETVPWEPTFKEPVVLNKAIQRGLEEMWFAINAKINEYWMYPGKYEGFQNVTVFILLVALDKDELIDDTKAFELYTSIMIKDESPNGKN